MEPQAQEHSSPNRPREPERVPVKVFSQYRAWPSTEMALRHLIFSADHNGLNLFGVVERPPIGPRGRVLINLPAFDRWYEAVLEGRVKVGKRRTAKARQAGQGA